MGKLPAFQFYPGDWMKDPSVRSVSLAARGLWLDMLCLMFESDRRGYLQLAGQPISAEQLARMVGEAPETIRPLLQELKTSGVFSSTEHGVIYSRRLVREEQERVAARIRKRESRNRERESGHNNVTVMSHPCPEDEVEDKISSSGGGDARGGGRPPPEVPDRDLIAEREFVEQLFALRWTNKNPNQDKSAAHNLLAEFQMRAIDGDTSWTQERLYERCKAYVSLGIECAYSMRRFLTDRVFELDESDWTRKNTPGQSRQETRRRGDMRRIDAQATAFQHDRQEREELASQYELADQIWSRLDMDVRRRVLSLARSDADEQGQSVLSKINVESGRCPRLLTKHVLSTQENSV